MEISKQRERLLTNVASLPGSRDIWGGPVLVVLPPPVISPAPPPPSMEDGTAGPLCYSHLVSLIGYLSTIPADEAITKGFTVIIDGRNVTPKTIRMVLRACQQALYKKVRQAIIVQPDKFLEQQKINLELLMEAFSFKTPCVSVHKLSKFVHITALPEVFGGTLSYDPIEWCANREKVERMARDLEHGLKELRVEGAAALSEPHAKLLKAGELLANEMATGSASEDDHTAALMLRRIVGNTKDVLTQPERKAKADADIETQRLADEHTTLVNGLLDWLERAGETWLLSLREIGESRDEARQLVKQHAQLKARAQELEQQSEELSSMSHRLAAALPMHAPTLDKSRTHVKAMVGTYISRVDRGAEMAGRSEQFHENMSMFTRRADALLDSLVTDMAAQDATAAQAQRAKIEDEVALLKTAYDDLMAFGTQFVDDLASNEINPHGKRAARDYSAGVAHIKEQLASANERRRRCLDLVDVRLLKLQQIIQLFTCESDAEQAVAWLREMGETLQREYAQMECSLDEVDALRADLNKLEDTARSTYEYGKQLCQMALVLRRSLRMGPAPKGGGTEEKLEQTVAHLSRALSENEAQLAITEGYIRTHEEVAEKLNDIERRAQSAGDRPARHVYLAAERRKIAQQIGELRHMADLMSANINAKHNRSAESRQDTIKRLRERLDTVALRQREVESLFTQ